MSSIRRFIRGGRKESGGGQGTPQDAVVPYVQPRVCAEGQNESDLQSPQVSSDALKSGHVYRGRKSPKQARSKRSDLFPVKGLALTRSIGDTVTIDTAEGTILIGVSWAASGKARLVFDAPKSMNIVRTELLKRESAA